MEETETERSGVRTARNADLRMNKAASFPSHSIIFFVPQTPGHGRFDTDASASICPSVVAEFTCEALSTITSFAFRLPSAYLLQSSWSLILERNDICMAFVSLLLGLDDASFLARM